MALAVIGQNGKHPRLLNHFRMAKRAARPLVKGKVISHPARTSIIAARPHICFLFFDRNNCFLREIHMDSSFAGHRAFQPPLLMCERRPVNMPRFSAKAKKPPDMASGGGTRERIVFGGRKIQLLAQGKAFFFQVIFRFCIRLKRSFQIHAVVDVPQRVLLLQQQRGIFLVNPGLHDWLG